VLGVEVWYESDKYDDDDEEYSDWSVGVSVSWVTKANCWNYGKCEETMRSDRIMEMMMKWNDEERGK